MKKEFIKGKFLLTHYRYINDMGFEVDSFDLFDIEKRVHYPFVPFIKVHNKGPDWPINRIPYEYNDEDYEKMIDENVYKYNLK